MTARTSARPDEDEVRTGQHVGSFRYFRNEDRWEWSDEVARMHGYAPGQAEPTTALLLSHKHPDDAASVALLIEAVTGESRPFSGRHRIVDTRGETHRVLVVGDRLCTDDGDTVIGSQGFYVDLSDVEGDGGVDAVIAEFTAHRAYIEQAKGILMVTYNISAERAFDILVWRSQQSNIKLRTLVRQVIADFTTRLTLPAHLRERADHLLLTAHRRVDGRTAPIRPRGDVC